MYKTLTKNNFTDELQSDTYSNYSLTACEMIYDLEEEMETQEIDHATIRGYYSEYISRTDACNDLGCDIDYLEDTYCIYELDNGCVLLQDNG